VDSVQERSESEMSGSSWSARVQGRVARRCTYDAMHPCVVCGATAGVHALEHARRSQRAWAQAGHRLERAPRTARVVAGHWASKAVCRRCRGRGSDRRLASYTSVHSVVHGDGIQGSRREGEVGLVRSLTGGAERGRAGRRLIIDWGCRVAVVQERRGRDLGKIASGISHPLCPSATGQGEEREEGNAS
jgi:hypothetical protein